MSISSTILTPLQTTPCALSCMLHASDTSYRIRMHRHYARPWRSHTHGRGIGSMGLRLRLRRRAGGLTKSVSLISDTDFCGDLRPIEGRKHRHLKPPLHMRRASRVLGNKIGAPGSGHLGLWSRLAQRQILDILQHSLEASPSAPRRQLGC